MSKTVDYSVRYVEKASRKELVIRIFRTIVSSIILGFLGIVGVAAIVLQFLNILFLGKRNRALHNWIFMVLDYETKLKAYASLLTDERNSMRPEN